MKNITEIAGSYYVKVLLAISLLTPYGVIMAAPQITSVARNLENQLVIGGSGFGKGPTVVLYDDFSSIQVSGDTIVLKPQLGEWLEFSHAGNPSDSIRPGLEDSQGYSLVARGSSGDISHKMTFGIRDSSGIHQLKHFQEIYFSYSIKDEGEFPGTAGTRTSFSNVSSTKDAWMMFGDRGDNTEYATSSGEPAGHDLYIPGWTGSSFIIAGNETQMDPGFTQNALKDYWAFGSWVTIMFHAELNPEGPYGNASGFFSFLNANYYDVNFRNGNFMTDQTSEGVPYPYWDRVKFFTWLREGDAEVLRLVDNIYVAIGENANARVLISDSPTLKSSKKIKHLLPVKWTDTSIIISNDSKEFGTLQYVHIINSENLSSDGAEICTDCPEPPSSVIVN